MSSIVGFFKRNYAAFISPPTPRNADDSSATSPPLKFGILGAAAIAPAALIIPAKSHPEVELYAVAARDISRAERFAKKHGIKKWYGGQDSYQKLLDDPAIDVVYNPLPNGLHYEWTMKALAAGKHVLLEKPSGDTAEETRRMFSLADQKGLVLLEAFHYRFHPAILRVKAIIDSGELGPIKEVNATLAVPKGVLDSVNDIRMNYDLGGGAMMDCGCYPLSCVRYLASSNPSAVTSATAVRYPKDPRIDIGTTADLTFPSSTPGGQPVRSTVKCTMSNSPRFGFIPKPEINVRAVCESGSIELFNFVMPVIYHYITVKPDGGIPRTEKAYAFKGDGGKGEEWWTTYRHQLEAFVDKVKGRAPQTWMSAEDSIANMEWIEKIYEESGLGSRPQSTYVFPTL
ncbi:NAD(P)-binding protein [Rhizopogon vinicolor AM-OR11-026]|uniref:D-xylose 1-dehydrogenase (NADP(+), D-xylono-1,5-lactone-forming) n=1 Tax=Rhizopogon vinicolor AM-OR11-026 TaxID=1314800 RepID=A0A1B7NBA5_9AGAM|nr:NAD(P)-binding protein [Rhizopogon vinicolor AM-OR11-026]